MVRLTDYIVDHAQLDWASLLSSWAWLLPRELTVWIMNRFGDLFLVFDDDSVHMLDVGVGSLKPVADDRDHFCRRLDEADNANNWLAIPLVDQLVAAGRIPGLGECYGYLQLPILGGEYTTENTRIVPISEHYSALGPIQEKLKEVPDGTHVRFESAG
jgi:hypothetical protein